MQSWLKHQVNKRPNQPAFYWQEETWTFSEINNEVKKWQAKFASEIPENEQRVALFSRNSKECYFSILALWELGKEILFLNTLLSVKEIDYQLIDANVNTIIVAADYQSQLTTLSTYRKIELCLVSNDKPSSLVTNRLQSNVASIMYTSGTTGNPKGVIQCFDNHLASALATQENMEITDQDCWLCSVPLFHISGLSIIVRQLVLGCSIRLYPMFNAKKVTEDLVQGKGTVISVVATTLQELLTIYPEKGYSSKFKGCLLGGGPISTQALEQCETFGIPVIQSYGMTETCSQIVALQFADASQHRGSAGKPLKGISLKIVDEEERILAANQIGEILVKGKNVIKNYLNEAAWKTEKWTTDGWFKTGDMGYLDEAGYLYLVSRLSELIISGGENIYPTEVEHILLEMPEISEIAIVGEKNLKWGAVPVAYVVGDHSLTVEQIHAFTKHSLAKFKQPKRLYFCEQLPKTASGKVAKHRLTTK